MIALSASVPVLGVFGGTDAAQAHGRRRYAALGSSFAAGPGIEPIVNESAGRSGRNYAHRVAAAHGLDLSDLTVSGATTETILDEPQEMDDGTVFPPQIDGVPADADIVTVTAGGNDIGYIGQFTDSAVAGVPDLDDPGSDEVELPTTADIDRACEGLVEIAERIHDKAPAARVVFVDYVTILDKDARPTVDAPFPADRIPALLELQSILEGIFRDAADRAGVELVAASRLTRGHGATSRRPWVMPLLRDEDERGNSFHPNASAMAAVARKLGHRLHRW